MLLETSALAELLAAQGNSPSGGQWVDDSARTAHKHQEAGECGEGGQWGRPSIPSPEASLGLPWLSPWKAGLRGRLGPSCSEGRESDTEGLCRLLWSLREPHLLVEKLSAEELLQFPG